MPNLRLASILMSLLTLLAGCGVCPMFEDLVASYTGVGTSVPNTDDLKGFSTTRPAIEAPLNNSEVPLFPLDVKSYAFHWLGITKAELVVNGVTVRTDPVTPEPDPEKPGYFLMSHIVQQWMPPAPGAYYLQVRVTNGGGNTEITYPVLVYVGGVATLDFTQIVQEFTATAAVLTGTPTATSTATATATLTQGASPTQPRITFTPSATLAATRTSTATSSATASATLAANAPFTTFTADSTSINTGQCTTLRWTSGNIQSIFLNNQAATGNENRQVCPTTTTTYTLLANSASGTISKQVTITVTNNGVPFTTFSADSTSINAGQCTTLHWNSGNITAIFLNNEGTVGTLDKQVCPTTTTLYRLRATTASSGDIIKEITIQVTGSVVASATVSASATTSASNPPQIGGLSVSTSQISNHEACGGNSVNVTVPITNAINVTLSFSTSGSSGSKAMSNQGGNNWAATVSVDNDNGDLPSLPSGPIQFSVSASGPGGSSSSGPIGGVTIMTCES